MRIQCRKLSSSIGLNSLLSRANSEYFNRFFGLIFKIFARQIDIGFVILEYSEFALDKKELSPMEEDCFNNVV